LNKQFVKILNENFCRKENKNHVICLLSTLRNVHGGAIQLIYFVNGGFQSCYSPARLLSNAVTRTYIVEKDKIMHLKRHFEIAHCNQHLQPIMSKIWRKIGVLIKKQTNFWFPNFIALLHLRFPL
jgi:hypothetical protein